MSMAKCKFDFLKTKGKWGAKSPDDEKIVAMAAEIKSLKGQLKLDPKLSATLFDRIALHIGVRRGREELIQIGIVAKKDVPIL